MKRAVVPGHLLLCTLTTAIFDCAVETILSSDSLTIDASCSVKPSAMVTNTELFKLITEFKDESKVTCENITKANEESIQVLTSAINGRLDLLDQRLNKIDDHHAAYDVKFEAMDERIDEVDTKANEALTSALNRIAILENKLLHLENVEIPNRLQQLKQENESLKDKVENIEDIEKSHAFCIMNITINY